jgi:5-methylcytosine-specific restriction enzyme A
MTTRSGNAHNRLTGRIGQAQRKRIRERDCYTCQNPKCNRAVNVGECDHVVSLDDGGTNDDSNLQLLCIECHKNKTAIDRGYKLTTGVDNSGMPTNVNHHWFK